ncbi:MAG TPA: tetratricopeptide repeat protein [Gemmatimonadaceae bacterium]|jgi:hypothetical protein
MRAKNAYKPTFLDRYGPDGGLYLRAIGGASLVLGVLATGCALFGYYKLGIALGCVAAGVAAVVPILIANGAGWTFKRFLVDGTSTPYVEQYSYQQALVMQGRTDDALASFEEIIAADATSIDSRLRAADLYAREKKNFVRATALFREVQRIDATPAGQFIFVTNRLADLYVGPLNDPGKAQVELRRLIELHPDSPAAAHARVALTRLKSLTDP